MSRRKHSNEGAKVQGQPLRKALLLLAGGLSMSAGCYAEKRAEAWTPKPRVEWGLITPQPVAPLHNEYRILAPQPTVGLFPANLVVTRVAIEEPKEAPAATRPVLLSDPRNEFLQWNTALDDQMAVSEVFPVDQRDLGGGEADTEQILAAFRGLHARLGLIYAVNELSETESEMFGALYDIETAQPVAVLHAQAVSIELPEEEKKKKGDPIYLWQTDSRALVRAKFADLLHRCIRQLIIHDQAELVETPAGWTPAGPIRPVEWPPRHLRPRR